MRARGLLVALPLACASASTQPALPSPPAAKHATAGPSSGSDGPEIAPDTLLAWALREWPGATASTRQELQLDRAATVSIAAAARDTCYRVFVRADLPVGARLETAAGTPLTAADGREFVLGQAGPHCVRAGEALRVVLSGSGAVKVLVRAAP